MVQSNQMQQFDARYGQPVIFTQQTFPQQQSQQGSASTNVNNKNMFSRMSNMVPGSIANKVPSTIMGYSTGFNATKSDDTNQENHEQEETKYEPKRIHYNVNRDPSHIPPLNNSNINQSDIEGNNNNNNDSTPQYQDTIFAIIFLIQFIIVISLAFTKGIPYIRAQEDSNALDQESNRTSSFHDLMGGIVIILFIAIAVSMGWVKFMITHASNIIQTGLIASIICPAVFGLFAIFWGSTLYAVFCFIFAAISFCYYRAVQSRIPFAVANIEVAVSAVTSYRGTFAVAFFLTILQIIWQLIWMTALMGSIFESSQNQKQVEIDGHNYEISQCTTGAFIEETGERTYSCACDNGEGVSGTLYDHKCPEEEMNAGLYFFLLLCQFWTSTVITNVAHVTTSGAVAMWWFNSQIADKPGVTWNAFKRAVTTSFGSICFGSLLVAILKTIRSIIRSAKEREDISPMVACILDCCLNILENMLSYFNRYAFVFVALYGKGFMESGKNALALFKNQGMTTIINDDLIGTTFFMGALISAFLNGFISYILSFIFGFDGQFQSLFLASAFIIGFFVFALVMSVIDSAVATVYVCWAEDPQALKEELRVPLGNAWHLALTGNIYK